MCRVVKAVCENPDNEYLREEHLYSYMYVMAQNINVAFLIFLGFECCLECGRSLTYFFSAFLSGYQVKVPSLVIWPGFLEVEHRHHTSRDLLQALALIKL